MGMAAFDPNGSTKWADFDGLDKAEGTPCLAAEGSDAGNVQGARAWLGQGEADDFRKNLALLKRIKEGVHHVSRESYS